MAGLRDALRVIMEASAPRAGETNAVRMFAGPMARTADQEALSRARHLAQSGSPREQIWNDTGWFQGADDKWRFEIDDSGASLALAPEPPSMVELANQYARDNFDVPSMIHMRVNDPRRLESIKYGQEHAPTLESLRAQRFPLGDVLDHPELYHAYPEARGVQVGREFDNGVHGSYSPSQRLMRLRNETPILGVPHDARSTGLHETQHVIQDTEGFARGGSPESAVRTLGFLPDPVVVAQAEILLGSGVKHYGSIDQAARMMRPFGAPEWQTAAIDIARNTPERIPILRAQLDLAKNPQELYRRLAGEVEARNVQTRRDFSPTERRQRPPWTTQDVPDEQQIVRFDTDGAASRALGNAIRVSAGLGGATMAGGITLRELLRADMQGS